MFKNYLKTAWRNLKNRKSHSLLNISGLAIGMACSILILLWVQNELSYDRFHSNAEDIYRLTADAGGGFNAAVTPAGMPIGLQQEMPEVKSTLRLFKPNQVLFQVGQQKYEELRVFYADSNFLKMFTFPMLEGDPKSALSSPNAVVISEATAKKYFGEGEVLGKTIRKDDSENLTITGVLANVPSNSHLQFDIILPMLNLAKTDEDLINDTWNNFNFYSYLQLDRNAITSLPKVEGRINEIYAARVDEFEINFHLQALTDIHLNSNLQIDLAGHGNPQYVNIFFVIAFIILIVACINFMNLATARSSRRAKEVGLRKVVGASRNQLIVQFLGESFLVSFLSLVVAVILVYLMLPTFNNISDKQLGIQLLDGKLLMNLLAVVLITGLVSGSYPALFLSSFRPVKVLKGKMKLANVHLLFRNGLVIIQFMVSLLLLVGTVVIYTQLNFIKSKNLGFEKENLLYLPMTGALGDKREAMETALKQHASTSNFSIISDLPANLSTGNVDIQWEGKDPNMQKVIQSIKVDENFLNVFQMQLLSGRDFSKEFATDISNYLINEKAAELMGMDVNSAVGRDLTFSERKGTIIGVVKDFNFRPLQYAIEPLILRWNRDNGIVVVRTQTGNIENTVQVLEEIFADLNPAYPLSYGFFDKDLENQYRGEQQMGTIFNIFALLAIFISCIGLYGLSAFMAEQRVKEIGIRKVLGASEMGLVQLLSRDFLRLIVIALLLATPLAWYAMSSWLEDFAFRINIQWWMFAFAAIAVLLVTLSTISFQTIKAASTNPVNSLRTE